MSPIRVVLADDHAVLRLGIRNLLNRAADIEVVGEAGNGCEAIQQVDELNPDVVLLDVEMPIMDGVEAARCLRSQGSPVRILVLSAYSDKHYILSMLAEGVDGYITKDEAPSTIIEAVRSVARGEQGWFSRKVAARLEGQSGNELRPTVLTANSLAKNIRAQVDTFQEKDPKLSFELDLQSDEQTISRQVHLAFGYIIKDILIYVIRHARARQVWIRFYIDEKQIQLSIKAGGESYAAQKNPEELDRQGNGGLARAQERIKDIGGCLEILSSPGEGTVFRVFISLMNSPDEGLNTQV